MTDPIQAAIERAEEAIRKALLTYGLLSQDFQAHLASPMHLAESLAAVMLVIHRQLAALVREYGHVRQCRCCDLKHPQHHFGQHHGVHIDPRCLPESREEKP